MDKRRTDQKSSKAVLIIALVAIVAIVGYIGYNIVREKLVPVVAMPQVEGTDDRAQSAPASLLSVFGGNNPYKYKKTIKMSLADSMAKIEIENTSKDKLIAYELILEGKDEVAFRSGYIKPEQVIQSVYLNLGLEAGNHNAVAIVSIIDPQTLDITDAYEHKVTIEIK